MVAANSDGSLAPPTAVHVRYLRTLLVWGIGLVLFLWFFNAFKIMILGTLAAAAVASALWPLVVRVHRSRAVSALVVGIGFCAVVAAIIAIIVLLLAKPIQEELQNLPETRQSLDASLKRFSQQFEISPPIETGTLMSQASNWLGKAGNLATSMGQVLVAIGVALVFVFIGSIYFLAEPRDNLVGPVIRALPLHRQRQAIAALDDLGPKLRGWLIGVLCSMVIVGLVSAIGYKIAGIKFAIPLALLAGLCELVPTVGPIVAGVVAVLVATTQGSGQVAGAVIVWAVVQILESYVLLPLIMRRAVRIPAVVTLFTVILWGEVFGAPGLFLAVPINLLIWTAFKHLVIENDSGADQAVTPPKPAMTQANIERETLLAEAHPT